MMQGFDTNQHDQGASRPDDRRLAEEQEFLGLLSALCESQATEEDIARLESLLQSQPKYVERYVSYMDMHGTLHLREIETAALAMASSLASASLVESCSAEPCSTETSAIPESLAEALDPIVVKPASYSSSLAIASRSAQGFGLFLAKFPLASSLATAASVMFCLLTTMGVLHLPSGGGGQAVVERLLEDSLAGEMGPTWAEYPLEVTAQQPVYVAKITSGQGQRWASAGLAMPPSLDLQAGQVLDLEGGLVEVMFLGGTRVILEGPVKFTVQSFDAGYLHRGKLVAQVVNCPDGFVVQTPKVTIVDLGTEFGVEVLPSETTDVQVFQGAVEATPNRPGGKRVRLTAGLSAQFYAQGSPLIEGTSGRAGRFVRPAEFAARRAARPKNIGRAPQSEPFVHFDVDFAGGVAGSHPKVASPVAGGVSTMPSAQKGAVLCDGYTDSATSETIGGEGQFVAELNEPFSRVGYASGETDLLRGTGVVTIEFDLLQDSACNRNVFFNLRDENLSVIGALLLRPSGRWLLMQYASTYAFDTTVEVGGDPDPDTRPGTPVHCIYQLDLDANEQRVSLDGGVTFSSASIPADRNYSQFGVHTATDWDRGSVVVGKIYIGSTSAQADAQNRIQR